ncbi:MAG: AraC family transcriptional regulator [Paramuribaculum sp.]|nr:AraC family transcriptional regulator [Paramuribaculum sp.]
MAIKPTREIVNNAVNTSFVLTHYVNPYFEAPFHFHPEYELILIEEGDGVRYVGDSVHKMRPGDFMLIGSNLAHLWMSDDRFYMPGCKETCHSIYSQFSPEVLPGNLSSIPEFHNVDHLLRESVRGLLFTGDNLERLAQQFRDIVDSKGVRRWTCLLTLLDDLSCHSEYKYLTTSSYDITTNTWSDKIVERVNQYIAVNYCQDITLKDLSDIAHMNESSLCRYYKRVTGRRIFDYLAQSRIEYSLKLLRSTSYPISQIAMECGYNSPSHFYHQFKTITGYSPTEYINRVLKVKRSTAGMN